MRGCGLIEITCPSGPKGGIRLGPSSDAIMFGPKAQKGVEVFLAPTSTVIFTEHINTRISSQK